MTYRITMLALALLCVRLGGDTDILQRLWTAQQEESNAAGEILRAMRENNLSSFEIVKGAFEEAWEPKIARHYREQVYTGSCWTTQNVENAAPAALVSSIFNGKLHLVPDYDTNQNEIAGLRYRKVQDRYRNQIADMAKSYSPVKRALANHPIMIKTKQTLANSWSVLVSPERSLASGQSELFRVRDRVTGQGFGYYLEELCTIPAGCSRSISYGASVRYCAFNSNLADTSEKPDEPKKSLPKTSKITPTKKIPVALPKKVKKN